MCLEMMVSGSCHDFCLFWLDFWFGSSSAEIEVIASGAMTLSEKHWLLHTVRLSYQLEGLKSQSCSLVQCETGKEEVVLGGAGVRA